MKFKQFRNLIFSPCYVVVGSTQTFVETHYDSTFDDYEVIGVRADSKNTIIVSLANLAVDTKIGKEESTCWR